VDEAVLAAPGAAGAGGGRHRTSFREVTDVLGKIRDAAISLYRLPPELSPKCDAAAAIRLLLDECSTASVPDDPDGAPIELLGWLEAVIDDAPHLFVVGMNEGSLPASSAGDPFLPERLRARLGIADDSSRYARDAMHLAAAMHSRESVRLVAGRRDTRGDPRRPSRLLLTGAGEALAWRVRALTAEQADGNTRPAPILVAAGSESGFALPPEPVLTFTVPSRLSVTGIRGVLQDPYRYVLEGVLGLERRDDDARELDPLAFGSLAHEVLGRFGHSDDRDSTDADRIADRLDAFLDEALRRRYTVTFPAVALQIEQLRFRLRAFARWQADRTVAGWRIIVVEGVPVRQGGEVDSSITLAAATSEVPFDVDGDPITLHGRIDRIDHHPDRGWAIFDYKTGDDVAKPNALHLEGGRWVDAQLPLYRHIARAISAENGDPVIPADAVVGLGYIALPRDPEETGAQMAEWSEDDLSSADEAVREAVRFIRRGVVEFTGLDGPAQAWDSLGILLGGRLLSAGIAGEGSADEGEGGDE
jgi:hypothetical protein